MGTLWQDMCPGVHPCPLHSLESPTLPRLWVVALWCLVCTPRGIYIRALPVPGCAQPRWDIEGRGYWALCLPSPWDCKTCGSLVPSNQISSFVRRFKNSALRTAHPTKCRLLLPKDHLFQESVIMSADSVHSVWFKYYPLLSSNKEKRSNAIIQCPFLR